MLKDGQKTDESNFKGGSSLYDEVEEVDDEDNSHNSSEIGVSSGSDIELEQMWYIIYIINNLYFILFVYFI